MSWTRCCQRIKLLCLRCTNIVMCEIWRWCDSVSDVSVIDFNLFYMGLVMNWCRLWWPNVRFLNMRHFFIRNFRSISMNVISCVINYLNTAVRELDFVASVNCTVFLLLRVGEVVTWSSISDCVWKLVLFLFVVRRWRFQQVNAVSELIIDSVLSSRNLNVVLSLKLVVTNFLAVWC